MIHYIHMTFNVKHYIYLINTIDLMI